MQVKRVICLNKGDPSSNAKYGFISNIEKYREGNMV